jgi:hypothetical protein
LIIVTIDPLHAGREAGAARFDRHRTGIGGCSARGGIASFAHHCHDIGFAAHNLAERGVAHMKDLLLFQRVNTKHGSLTW